jgi:hypothetical protein
MDTATAVDTAADELMRELSQMPVDDELIEAAAAPPPSLKRRRSPSPPAAALPEDATASNNPAFCVDVLKSGVVHLRNFLSADEQLQMVQQALKIGAHEFYDCDCEKTKKMKVTVR